MSKTIRNEFDKALTYENLMKAHLQSRKGKGYRKDIILFNLKQEEYIMWLYEQLQTGEYKHSGYSVFYITQPKLRRIEKSIYIDRIVHRWYVNSFIEKYFIPQFIHTSYACIKNKGMHKACLDLQKAVKHCKVIWEDYYILKMDVRKYFENINKNILLEILQRKIKDEKVLWLTKEIIYSNEGETGLPIRKLYFSNVCKYLSKRTRPICKTPAKMQILLAIYGRCCNTHKDKRRSKRGFDKYKNIFERKSKT